jgi:Na+/H+-dicarboxylate symporter
MATKKMALHWKILMGMGLGLVFGLLSHTFQIQYFVSDYIKPIGTIFINLLKLIAIPLILASLIKGIADLQDISKFSKMGLRTIIYYLSTTLIAVTLGIILVNIIRPGDTISAETVAQLSQDYKSVADSKITNAEQTKGRGPLQFLIDIVPENIFGAASSNGNMLQIIFFAIFFGISLLLIDVQKAKPIKDFFEGLNEVVMKMVDLIMLSAPYAVFALIAALVSEISNAEIFKALALYMFTVIIGLILMVGIYMLMLKYLAKYNPFEFIKKIAPAQLLAFSTSSSAATLPVTMERLEEHVGVDKEVTSFVCPVGATVNMDGTSLYQAVAAIFICEALKFDLTFADQLTIIITTTLASIGTAAVPGAGIIMLVIVLESVGLPSSALAAGLALIVSVDRPLDMMRTVINITGDCTVATIIARHFGKLNPPDVKNWDDNKTQAFGA